MSKHERVIASLAATSEEQKQLICCNPTDDKGYTLMAPDLVPIAMSSSLGSKAKALG